MDGGAVVDIALRFDGNAAMAACNSASDYASVCAGRRAGDPSQRQTWALPHHNKPGGPADPQGVANALGRFGQTQGLINGPAAKAHLEAHERALGMGDDAKSAIPTENLVRALYPGAEVRENEDGPPVLFGHFARFDEWTEIDSVFEGRFMEKIAPGAFADSFAAGPPKAMFQHGRDPELGDKVLGSPVTVREDAEGAYYEVPLFRSVPPLVLDGLRAGAYGASFRFSVNGEEVTRKPEKSDANPDGLPERTITSARVAEFGPVTFPAYSGATAGVRSLTDQFRPHDFDAEVAQMAREHPATLARTIERVLKEHGSEDKPPEDKPLPPPRFRSREEFLQWMSQS